MNPFVSIAAGLFPQIIETICSAQAQSDKAASEKIEDAIVKVVKTAAGTEDIQQAQVALQDPAKASVARTELARIAVEETKVRLEAEQKKRETELAAEQQKSNTALEGLKTKLDAERRQQLAELGDIQNARAFQQALINSPLAWVPPALSLIVTLGFFSILVLFIFMKSQLENYTLVLPTGVSLKDTSVDHLRVLLTASRSDFVVQIINICVGALAAAFATVMSYWLGSSRGSQSKDLLVAQLQKEQSQQATAIVGEAAKVVTRGKPGPQEEQDESATEPRGGGPRGTGPAAPAEPAKPAPPGLLAELLPELTKTHQHFPGSVQWALTPRGLAIDGAAPMGTPGEPTTIRKIWSSFGRDCLVSAKRYGVPIELIVATIATESSGNPNSRRAEPQIGDESVGLMQTLVKTARDATGKSSLRGDDLLDPATSIDAGTAYIAKQRGSTHFDPPLVAAAYNAGSLRLDNADANRWKLHCFPRGTGQHVDRFVSWFADCMRVSGAQKWAADADIPSFASAFGFQEVDKSNRDFPAPPSFEPLISTSQRQAIFGAFGFKPSPTANNPEAITVTDNWAADNIVDVAIPVAKIMGKAGPLQMSFHKKCKDQLIGLWLDWEKAGLLDRVLTFEGAYVPRFIRGSRTMLSNHAFGTAFDINAGFNPLDKMPALVGEKGCVRELVQIANKWGFYWGGHFANRPDGMHFEVAEVRTAPRS